MQGKKIFDSIWISGTTGQGIHAANGITPERRIDMDMKMEQILNYYYENEAERLRSMVDRVLAKLRFYNADKDEFYSLANEVFAVAVRHYDSSKPFEAFLYSCLYKKFCTQMTRNTCRKRCQKIKISGTDQDGNYKERIVIIPDEHLDAPMGEDGNSTLLDTVAEKNSTEEIYLENSGDAYSEKMTRYLSRLSHTQKEVLMLTIAGYLPKEIMEELSLSRKQYDRCTAAIHAYRNVSLLF